MCREPAGFAVGLRSSPRLSLQGERFTRGNLEQRTRLFVAETNLKGIWGMLEMPVLSQMILARVTVFSDFLWLGVNTPRFSCHNLSMANRTKS